MSFAKIKGKLSSRIGRPVHFGPPEDVKRKGGGAGAGSIIDEVWVYGLPSFRFNSSGSLVKFTAIRRASSLVSSLAAEHRPGSSSK